MHQIYRNLIIMDIEQQLKERYGVDSHFIIPNQYIESFEAKILSQTTQTALANEEKHHPSIWVRLRPLVIAASFVGLCGLSGVILTKFAALSKDNNAHHQAQRTETTVTETSDAVDQLADYAMLDDDDVYAILADN